MSIKLPRTRLELLMNMTNVTGKTIANLLHVDMSLVSRWKNGQRKMNHDVIEPLALFFVEVEEGAFLNNIELLVNKSENKESSLVSLLSNWLALPIQANDKNRVVYADLNKSSEESTTNYQSFFGNEGRRKSVIYLFEKVLSLETKTDIYLYSNEDMSWLIEDQSFLLEWSLYLKKILQNKHQVYIIHTMNRSINELMKALLNWIPIYLAGNVHAYRLNEVMETSHWHTIFVVKNTLCIGGYNTGDDITKRFTMMTNDIISVQSLDYVYQQMLYKSTMLTKSLIGIEVPKMLSNFTNVGSKNESSYFKSDELFFTLFEEVDLINLLKKNNVSQIKSESCLNFYHLLRKNFNINVSTYKNTHIYNLEFLKQLAKLDSFECFHLSMIIGETIVVDQLDYIKQIKTTIMRLEENDYYQIGLFIPSMTKLPLTDVNLWVKDSYFSAIWSRSESSRLVMSVEPTMIEAFDQFYQTIWKSIPYMDKDKEHVIEHLDKLLLLMK